MFCLRHIPYLRPLLLGLLLVLAGSGCQTVEDTHALLDRHLQPPPAVVNNAFQAPSLPPTVRRVAVLPIYWEAYREEADAHLDRSWQNALMAQHRFEVVTVSRTWLRTHFGEPQWASDAALPPDLLLQVIAETAADAVLLTDFTHWQPYQPLAVSVRARLLAFPQGDVLWAIDEVISSQSPAIVTAAHRARRDRADRPEPTLPDSTLYSPRLFWALSSDALAQTLPPISPPASSAL